MAQGPAGEGRPRLGRARHWATCKAQAERVSGRCSKRVLHLVVRETAAMQSRTALQAKVCCSEYRYRKKHDGNVAAPDSGTGINGSSLACQRQRCLPPNAGGTAGVEGGGP